MDKQTALTNYIQTFEQLTHNHLPDLGKLLSKDILFKDPFNRVTGRQATLVIFEHMFNTSQAPKFKVMNAVLDGDIALLYWEFNFVLPSNQSKQMIEGMSRVRFDENGLVKEHIDYWDAAEQVYSKVPILSWLIGLIRKRLSASN